MQGNSSQGDAILNNLFFISVCKAAGQAGQELRSPLLHVSKMRLTDSTLDMKAHILGYTPGQLFFNLQEEISFKSGMGF